MVHYLIPVGSTDDSRGKNENNLKMIAKMKVKAGERLLIDDAIVGEVYCIPLKTIISPIRLSSQYRLRTFCLFAKNNIGMI